MKRNLHTINALRCEDASKYSEVVTVPGQAQSVPDLYAQFVLGQLDPRVLSAGALEYDTDAQTGDVDLDPTARALSYEEALQMHEHARNTYKEHAKQPTEKGVHGNEPQNDAKPDDQNDHAATE